MLFLAKVCSNYPLAWRCLLSATILSTALIFVSYQTSLRTKAPKTAGIEKQISKPERDQENQIIFSEDSVHHSHSNSKLPVKSTSENSRRLSSAPKDINKKAYVEREAFKGWIKKYLDQKCASVPEDDLCQVHDPRMHYDLLSEGEKLAINYFQALEINKPLSLEAREGREFIFSKLGLLPSSVRERLLIHQNSSISPTKTTAILSTSPKIAPEFVAKGTELPALIASNHYRQRRAGSTTAQNISHLSLPPEVRKVLVIPARFLEETTQFDPIISNIGSNMLLTNEWSETIVEEASKRHLRANRP